MNSEVSTLSSIPLVRSGDEVAVRFDQQSFAAAGRALHEMTIGPEQLLCGEERVDMERELLSLQRKEVKCTSGAPKETITFSTQELVLGQWKARDFFVHGPELELRLCCCSDNREQIIHHLKVLGRRGDFYGPIRESLAAIINPISRYFPQQESPVPTGRELLVVSGDQQYAMRAFMIIFDYDKVDHALAALRGYALSSEVPHALTPDQAQGLTFLVKQSIEPPSEWD